MPILRIETVQDKVSQLYYVEIYYPSDSTVPYVTTSPRYKNAATAEQDVIALIAVNANSPGPR